jgi:beta-N-acetylhexosaminidase
MDRELERKAANLLTVGFHGRSVDGDLKSLLDRGVGGVIWFRRNVGTPAEVLELNREIKAAAARPLVISVDQEGGPVARLREGFTPLPPMRAVGALGSAPLAKKLGGLMARELRAVGFDMNYAPVLDVDTNPRNPVIGARSFGPTPELVSELGVALAEGLQEAGVAACGKHFPGHGDTDQDSHLALPRLPHDLERLERVELAPFAAAARSGVAALMTAHVIFEPIDAAFPATMSRGVISGILREKLGYDGLVISDDLEMKAIRDHFGIEEAMLLGLNAGVDHFLCCSSAELAHQAIDAVVRGVQRGKIELHILDAAVRRFSLLRDRFAQPAPDPSNLSALRAPEHLALAELLASASTKSPGADPTEREGAGRASQ